MHPKVLIAFMLYQGQLQEYTSNLLNSMTNLIKAGGSGAKVFELLERKPEPVFKFEAGPSLYSGLSPAASPNPLKHIFQSETSAPWNPPPSLRQPVRVARI